MKALSGIFCQITALSIFGCFVSCTHEPMGVENLEPVCFESQVLPVFQTSCGISGCHTSGQEFDATTYASIVKHVKPGQPRQSEVYKVITSPLNPEMMPPDHSLTKEQRTLIEVWILQGAKNTSCSATK